ncbi:MAG: hypothetical protein VR73_13565 [Gammaproteobacteria bacterium BRH_c0]|nr:MAG: hypothetical protein VR73_13565 [Gammaproteobacteria bacterium BRH_c0]
MRLGRAPFLQELGRIAYLALPLLIGQLAIVGLTVTDVIMSGRAGTEQLAGVTLGATLFDLPMMFLVGVFIANGAMVGRLHGAGDSSGLRHQFHNSLWLALPVGVLAIVAVMLMRFYVLDWLDAAPDAKTVAMDYLLPMTASAFILPFVLAFRTGFEGMGKPGVAMVFNLLGFAVNIPLDYALIYGHWGLPALGGAGCGWATLIVVLMITAGEVIYTRRAEFMRSLALLRRDVLPEGLLPGDLWPAVNTLKRTLFMGFPIGSAILCEAGFFHMIPLVIATLGSVAVASHGVAMTLDMMMFMVPLALSQAITLLVAKNLGAGNPQGARLTGITGIVAGFAAALVQCGVFLLLRDQLTALYSSDPQVVNLASSLLLFAAVIRLFDALHICGTGILRGYGDTHSTLVISIIAFWLIGFPLCLWLVAGSDVEAGVRGAWTAILVAVVCAGGMTLWRVRRILVGGRRSEVGGRRSEV